VQTSIVLPGEEIRRPSLRFVLLVLFALVLLLVGLFVSEPIIFVSVPIVAFLGFLILQLKLPEVSKVQVTRTLEKVQINEEDICRVRLAVKNSSASEFLLQIRDWVPPELYGENTRPSFTITLNAGESRNLLYEVKGNYYGEYWLGPTTLSAEDRGGLVESSIVQKPSSRLLVFPKTAGKLSGFTIGPKTTRPRPGEIHSRRVGAGMDFFTTRELLPGENARRINWKASARLPEEDKLLSNEYTSQRVAETLIILDCRGNVGPKESSLTTYSVRAAMSISERLLRDKNHVGLLTIGDISERVAPSYGRRQYDRIAMTLSRFSPRRTSFFGENVSYTIRYFYPRVSQIVLISPLMDQDNLYIALDLARSSTTFDLLILSPNPLDFPLEKNHKSKLAKTREGRIAWKLAEMERKAMIKQLEATRTIVLDWRVTEPLEQLVASHRQSVARRIAQLAVGR
jgi:uncharacterized protein (DUF58 family)